MQPLPPHDSEARRDHSRSPWPVATANNLSSLSLSNCSWALWSRPFQDSGLLAAQAGWPRTPRLTSPGQAPTTVGQCLALGGAPRLAGPGGLSMGSAGSRGFWLFRQPGGGRAHWGGHRLRRLPGKEPCVRAGCLKSTANVRMTTLCWLGRGQGASMQGGGGVERAGPGSGRAAGGMAEFQPHRNPLTSFLILKMGTTNPSRGDVVRIK